MFAEAPQFMGTCNCCSCCCGILHGPKLAGLDPSTKGPQKSNYRAVIDVEACMACGICIARCPVDAIAEDPATEAGFVRRAAGGRTVPGRPSGPGQVYRLRRMRDRLRKDAIEMVPVSEEEWFHVPESMAEWEEMRLQNLPAQK